MASEPFFDRGRWRITYWAGELHPGKLTAKGKPAKKYKTETLCKVAGWQDGHRIPTKPPTDALMAARAIEDKEHAIKVGIRPPEVRHLSIAKLLNAHVARYAVANPRSAHNCRLFVKKFLAWCEQEKIANVAELTTGRCRDWITFRLAGGSKRSTVQTERATLA